MEFYDVCKAKAAVALLFRISAANVANGWLPIIMGIYNTGLMWTWKLPIVYCVVSTSQRQQKRRILGNPALSAFVDKFSSGKIAL
jgi:hypothetical protein